MPALTLLIIRHAEKPNDDQLGPGLTAEGAEDKKSLVVRGWQRAGAWAALFGSSLGGLDYPRPDIVYAADPNQDDIPAGSGDKPSKRPFETIAPLCARIDQAPISKWKVGQEAGLVSEITQLTGVVLVCWEHKRIVSSIVPAITKGQNLPGLPSKWNVDRFDVVLRFDRLTAGATWSFRQLFPRLLAGDSEVPLES